MKKRGQLDLSFGMIWAIILIIIFIAFAIYIILTFVNFSNKAKIEQFQESFQSSIDKIQKGQQGTNTVTYSIPSKIEKMCFFNREAGSKGNSSLYNTFVGLSTRENLMFYPENSGEGENGIVIKNINLENITSKENPYCINSVKGKITFNLRMNYGENSVIVTR